MGSRIKLTASRLVVSANTGRRVYRRSLNVSMERRKGLMEKEKNVLRKGGFKERQ